MADSRKRDAKPDNQQAAGDLAQRGLEYGKTVAYMTNSNDQLLYSILTNVPKMQNS